MEALIPLFGVIMPFATAFGIIYIIWSTRHRERMSMIEKGMDPEASKPAPDPRKAMRNGLLMIGIGVGLLAAWLFHQHAMDPDRDSLLPYFMGPAIFGGLALVVYYLRFGPKDRA
ncbi:MAG: hypothetical protein KIT10_15215 [Flavobacteriales bacterium]|nr:hypothetical protein [Flavobacteriales bacterium]